MHPSGCMIFFSLTLTGKLAMVEHVEDLQADVEAAQLAKSIDSVKVYEAEYLLSSGSEATDAQNMLCSDSGADSIEDLQTAVEAAGLVDRSVADLVTNVYEAADIQNRLCSESHAIENNQGDNGQVIVTNRRQIHQPYPQQVRCTAGLPSFLPKQGMLNNASYGQLVPQQPDLYTAPSLICTQSCLPQAPAVGGS